MEPGHRTVAVAVLSGGQGGGARPPMRTLAPVSPLMKLVAVQQGYIIAVFTVWHHV